MSGLSAVMYREGKIRATNGLFIFWDVVYPLGYLLVFGVGMNEALGFSGLPTDYHEFFLAGVLGMASFGIASNTAWSSTRRASTGTMSASMPTVWISPSI